MTEWWTVSDAGMIGGIGGGALGLLGAGLGCAAGVLVPRGRGKPVVMGLLALLTVLGVALAVAAGVALASSQPYHVWYPLALGGGMLVFSVTPLIFIVPRMYRQAEARRLQAEELRRAS